MTGQIHTSGVPSMPHSMLQQAARRLGVAALVWAALWALGLFMNLVVAPLLSPAASLDDAWPWPGAPTALAVIGISLALAWYVRRRDIDPACALSLGAAYQIALAFAIGLVNQWTPNVNGLSWICVLVLVFPFIVPNQPSKTLAVALAAASMDAVGLAIAAARGVEMPPLSSLVWASLPNFVCAALAVVPAHVVRHLGREVSRLQRLGGYRIGERLGVGGMGEVYRATHDVLQRPAAIKLIRPELAGASSPEAMRVLVERFVREANAAAMLRSPNTIDLYDFGVGADGTLYHVMELLDGVNLEELVRAHGPVPAERAVHILAQVCDSLAEAHSLGLVHRDIKPANIQLGRYGLDIDHVKVLDFGLVKELGDARPDLATLTSPDIVIGTPAFMPPELALGEPVDARSDLYALGCVAYWLLTGRHVFEGDTVVAVAAQQLHALPEPPSRHSRSPVPPELDALVLECLAKQPADRPGSAAELGRRLRALPLAEPWSAERADRWWRAVERTRESAPPAPPAEDRPPPYIAMSPASNRA